MEFDLLDSRENAEHNAVGSLGISISSAPHDIYETKPLNSVYKLTGAAY